MLVLSRGPPGFHFPFSGKHRPGQHLPLSNRTYIRQRCMVLPVVVVQESIADEFVALLKKFTSEMKIGPACDPASQREWVENSIQRGADEGAEGGCHVGISVPGGRPRGRATEVRLFPES